jgi:glutathione S-transferase
MGKVTLYNTPSSYYSMIARLALLENKISFQSSKVEIHRKKEQMAPSYARMNPNMTVPTLHVVPPGPHAKPIILSDSRDILKFAFSPRKWETEEGLSHVLCDAETERWIDRHYHLSIEDLTMSWLLSWNPLARRHFPKMLESAHTLMLQRAYEHEDIAAAYLARAQLFETRIRKFDPSNARNLFAARMDEAVTLLGAISTTLNDHPSRLFLACDTYTAADVCTAVFLARLRFVGKGAEIDSRPAVRKYEQGLLFRPATVQADLWTSLRPWRMFQQVFL